MTLQRDRAQDSTSQDMGDIRELTKVIDGLISMMAAGSIESLKLEYGSLRLSLQSKDRRSRRTDSAAEASYSPPQGQSPPVAEPTDHLVTAPMIGTFYVAPAPNEPPFVSPGDHVAEGQTVGIIEAMKIMNEIAADRSGMVVEVVAGDGQTVEYGSPLVRIEPVSG